LLSWPEEVIAGLVFVAAFAVFRGLYGLVPFLFSLGIAAISAGLAVAAWKFLSDSDVWLGPVRLKTGGRARRAGWVFAVAVVTLLGFSAHSGVVRLLEVRAGALYDSTADLRRTALDLERDSTVLAADDRRRVAGARAAMQRLEDWSLVATSATELKLAWLAMLGGDRSAAKSRVDRVLRQRSNDPQAHLLAARLLVADRRFQDAASAYGRVIELDGDNPLGYLGRGAVLGRTGQLEAAGEVFSRGSAAIPGSADLRYNYGVSLALSGDLAGAEREFRAALRLDSEHLPARENLGGVLAAGGRFDEAIPIFEEAIRRSPNDAELRLMAARVFLGAGRRAEAAEQIEIAAELDPRMEAARDLLD
jgi:tetratricopeptide (TPR) repeat protein